MTDIDRHPEGLEMKIDCPKCGTEIVIDQLFLHLRYGDDPIDLLALQDRLAEADGLLTKANQFFDALPDMDTAVWHPDKSLKKAIKAALEGLGDDRIL